jgi:hypothetical protein
LMKGFRETLSGYSRSRRDRTVLIVIKTRSNSQSRAAFSWPGLQGMDFVRQHNACDFLKVHPILILP